jgi:hypothetical protein
VSKKLLRIISADFEVTSQIFYIRQIHAKEDWPYKRNIETRSRNHCCCGKAVNITYSECVSVVLIIQNAKRMRHIVLPSVTCLDVPYCTAICDVSGCTILYCHLWRVWMYHILLPSVTCLDEPYFIAICDVSGCTILYCHLWRVWMYHILLPSVTCLDVPYFRHYSINGTILGEKLLDIKCALIFCTPFVWNSFNCTNNGARCYRKCT